MGFRGRGHREKLLGRCQVAAQGARGPGITNKPRQMTAAGG